MPERVRVTLEAMADNAHPLRRLAGLMKSLGRYWGWRVIEWDVVKKEKEQEQEQEQEQAS